MNLSFSQNDILNGFLRMGGAIAILVVGYILARLIHRWIVRLGARNRMAMSLAALLANLAQVGILVFAIVLVLPTFGIDWTALLTVVGTVGLAVSLAFQDLLRNFIAGVYILIERPFDIGDEIVVGTDVANAGTVQAIALRTTSLRTPNGLLVIVPNGTIFTSTVTNRSAINLHRHLLDLALPAGQYTLAATTSRITQALHTVPDVAGTPGPTTRVESITKETLKLQVEFWSDPEKSLAVEAAVALALRDALPEADITVTG